MKKNDEKTKNTEQQEETTFEQQAEDATADYATVDEQPEEATPSKEEEYLALAQRIQADFDNFRKRNASVRADAMLDGKIDAIKAFLPVMDNLERALETEKANGTQGSLMEGLDLVLKQMAQTLSDLGVEEIEALGLPFDPACHNAMMQIPCAEGQKPGEVAQVFSKGYKIKDKVIRYSMVQVTI